MLNADQALIHNFQSQTGPVPIDTNPLARSLRATLTRVDKISGEIGVAFKPGADFLQAAHRVQGGAIACMLDFAMMYAAMAVYPADHSLVTTNLNVSFMRGAIAGELACEGRVIKRGKAFVFAEGRIVDTRRELIASATATVFVASSTTAQSS